MENQRWQRFHKNERPEIILPETTTGPKFKDFPTPYNNNNSNNFNKKQTCKTYKWKHR